MGRLKDGHIANVSRSFLKTLIMKWIIKTFGRKIEDKIYLGHGNFARCMI
jgi:hypothetical protein